MPEFQTLALLIGAGGLGGLLTQLLRGVQEWRSGEHAREKERNLDAISQRDVAVKERDRAVDELDAEIAYRRQVAEHASQLRRLLIEHGTDPTDLPAWPKGSA